MRRNSGDWRCDIHDGAVCIATVSNGIINRFFVRGVGIAEGTGDVLAEIRGSDANSATAVFYVVNHRGDTLNAYVSGIGLIASYRYDAFGNVIQFSCAAGRTNLLPRYTFSTKEYLPDAKLYLYAYRVYDPVAGRWTQRDPIDYQDSVNLYQFCGNNPVDTVDTRGKKGLTILFISVYWDQDNMTETDKEAERAHEKSHRNDFWNGKQFTEEVWQQEQRAWQEDVKVYEKALKDPTLSPEERARIEGELETARIMTTEEGAKEYSNYREPSLEVTPQQEEHYRNNPARVFIPSQPS
jgi:RHS repeat-associated protein